MVRTTVIEYTSAPLRRRNRTYDGITQRAAGRSRRQSSAKRRKNKANRKKYILTQPMYIGTECGRLANIQKTSMERKRERKKNWLHTIHDECPWLTHTRKKSIYFILVYVALLRWHVRVFMCSRRFCHFNRRRPASPPSCPLCPANLSDSEKETNNPCPFEYSIFFLHLLRYY